MLTLKEDMAKNTIMNMPKMTIYILNLLIKEKYRTRIKDKGKRHLMLMESSML